MIKGKIFPAVFLLSICAGLSAQTTADEIETLLAASAVTYSQAARFVLEASEALVTGDQNGAFNYAVERNWLPKHAMPNMAARLDVISLFLMKAFDLKGGLFYSMTRNAHYAYREMEYKNLIRPGSYPSMNVSGALLLFMTGRILEEVQ